MTNFKVHIILSLNRQHRIVSSLLTPTSVNMRVSSYSLQLDCGDQASYFITFKNGLNTLLGAIYQKFKA